MIVVKTRVNSFQDEFGITAWEFRFIVDEETEVEFGTKEDAEKALCETLAYVFDCEIQIEEMESEGA